MTKREIESFIADMKKGSIVTKATPWMFEGVGEKGLEVRYVGIKLPPEWSEIMSSSNNLLLRFTHSRGDSRIEFLLANSSPFFKFWTQRLSGGEKWEHVLGEMKRRLKKDKDEVVNHREKVGNLYQEILPHLKK